MPVNTRIQVRRGTAGAGETQWSTQVLYAGEIGYETDTGKFKIGDGTTAWSSLGYASILPSELDELVEDIIGSHVVGGSGISVSYNDSNGNTTVSLSDPTIQASDVTDFSEAVDDRVGSLLVAGTGVGLSYNDGANTLTINTNLIAGSGISISGATISLSDPIVDAGDVTGLSEAIDDRVNDLLVAGSNVQLTYNDGSNSLTVAVTGVSLTGHTHTASNITDFNSAVSGLLPVKDVVAGSGISVSSSSGSFTINLSDPTIQAADVTDFSEAVDDRVSNLLVAGSGVSLIYNDGSNTLTVNSALTAGSGIAVSENNGIYTVSLSDPTIQVADITDLTASAAEINLVDGSVANTVVNSKAVIYGSSGEVAASSVTTTGNVTVGGDLIVNGATTTVNSTTVTVDDPIFTLGGDTAPASDDNKDRGIEFRYHSGSAKVGFFGYDDSTGKFTFIPEATNSSEVFSGTKGEIDANVDFANILNKPDPVITVTLSGDVTGTANTTLTDLASGTVTVSTTIAANSVALGTDTTGDYVASVAVSGVGLSVAGSGENATYTITSNATSSNTISTIVARDSSGNFSAGNITASTLTNATLTNCVIDGGTP